MGAWQGRWWRHKYFWGSFPRHPDVTGAVGADLQRPRDLPELLRTLSLHQQADQGGGCCTWPTRWDCYLPLFFSYDPWIQKWTREKLRYQRHSYPRRASLPLMQPPTHSTTLQANPHTRSFPVKWRGLFQAASGRGACLWLLPKEKQKSHFRSFLHLVLCEPPEFRINQMSSWRTILLRAMKYKYKDNTLAQEITHDFVREASGEMRWETEYSWKSLGW